MRSRLWLAWMLWCVVWSLSACGADEETPDPAPAQPAAVAAYFDLSDDAGFWDCPFPIEHMRRADGTVRYDRFPNRFDNWLTQLYLDQADAAAEGFARGGAIHFRFDGQIDAANLPTTWRHSLDDDCPVLLVNVQPGSARYGERVPLTAHWRTAMGTYLPQYTLTLLPYQGKPLAPGEYYAAIVRTGLGDRYGRPLAIDAKFAAVMAGDWPEGDFAAADRPAFAALGDYLTDAGLAVGDVAVATVFRPGDPVARMKKIRAAVNALSAPEIRNVKLLADYPTYYVLEAETTLPIWQDGSRPYYDKGGRIYFDDDGDPVLVWWEWVRFAVSIPKGTMPDGGWPLLFYANGQGGSYTQVFDRAPGETNVPGEGPGKLLAHRGIACLDIEMAMTGPRHPLGSMTGIEFTNPLNSVAFRDNIRQAASDYIFLLKVARTLTIDPALVPEADPGAAESFFFDPDNFLFWGHSTGATVGDVLLGVEDAYRAALLTGAGVSWIYNLVYKQSPLPLGLALDWVLNADDWSEYHPLATVFQTTADGAEAANFAPWWIDRAQPRDVLLIGGYADAYFPPPMIEGLAVAAGLDQGGEQVQPYSLDALETLGGRGQVSLPASGNIAADQGKATGVWLQVEAPANLDGHYVAFNVEETMYQWSCFFASAVADGMATVPAPKGDVYAACP